jgi:hypothetical protein
VSTTVIRFGLRKIIGSVTLTACLPGRVDDQPVRPP